MDKAQEDNTPLRSILKSPATPRRNVGFIQKPGVRFDELVGTEYSDIVSVLKSYANSQNEAQFLKLLQLKNDPNVKDIVLRRILQQLEDATYILGPKVEKFVDALLNVSWIARPPDIVSLYQNFLLNLVSLNPFYCKPVVRMIAKLFQKACGTESGVENAHQVILGMTRIVPLSRNVILEVLSDSLPYIGTASNEQVSYARNLLRLAEYLDNARSFVLSILCNRLLKLDVNTPRDLIRRSEEAVAQETGENRMSLPSAATMDELMMVLFTYIQNECQKGWTETCCLYRDLLGIFETLLLPAADLHHAPFVLFFICSIKTALHEGFIDKLWAIFENPALAYVLRKSAMDYMGSYLARAQYIPVRTVLVCLDKFCKWIHKYIARQSETRAVSFSVHAHLPFYFVCGAVFEIIGARWSDFAGNRKHLTSLEALNLPRIVSCSLNPLRFCHPEVVKQFSHAGSYLQVVLCETIIAENRRHFVLGGTEEFMITGDPQFPFDCYLLKRSSSFVEPLLRQPVKIPDVVPPTAVKTVDEDDDKDYFMDDLDESVVVKSVVEELMYN